MRSPRTSCGSHPLETGQWKETVATNFTPAKATLASPSSSPVDFRTYTPISVFILDEYDGAYSIRAIERFHTAHAQYRKNVWEAVDETEKTESRIDDAEEDLFDSPEGLMFRTWLASRDDPARADTVSRIETAIAMHENTKMLVELSGALDRIGSELQFIRETLQQ